MSEESVEIVRAAIDAGNRRDWDGVFRNAAADFEFDNSRAIGTDNRGVFSAGEAIEMFQAVDDLWESFWIEINELIALGDHVVVPHTFHFRGREGIETQARTTWLFTIRGGEIERICLYQDTKEALEAVGESE